MAARQLELVNVTRRENLSPRRIEEGSHQMLALLTASNESERDAIARRRTACLAQSRGINNIRKTHRRSSTLQELTSIDAL